MDYAEKMQRCHDYVRGLEEERRKIQVFQRELPLCLELVTQAIETCKQQLSGTTTEQSECSSDRRPVLEEFIPIKPCSEPHHQSTSDKKKSDWLQLWNPIHQDVCGKDEATVEVKTNGGAFKPFRKEKSGNSNGTPAVQAAAASSSLETVTRDCDEKGSNKEEKEGKRKQRRCWSPELHRRFIQALQQLGGSHVATPKQIREFMKVEGLTNDEVKSHLQKYRLHTRRPSSVVHNNVNQQAPQFLVVGGIWVPPSEYAAVSGEATSTVPVAANGIFKPIAAAPPPHPSRPHQKDLEMGSHSEGVHSHTPSTSSSTHTTTASHSL